MRRALFVAAVLALAAPGAASAHALLKAASPGSHARVDASPAKVTLHFSQRVAVFPDSIRVVDGRGVRLSSVARLLPDGRSIEAPVRRLATGGYTVRWRAISVGDGHIVRGVFTFGVGVAAPPVTEAFGASGPTTAEHVVRWLYFLALTALIGGLAFRLLILRGAAVPRAAERRFYWLVGGGVVAALEVGVLAFLLRAHDALQLPFTGFLYGDLSPVANGTRFGQAFIAMTLGFALVSALIFLAWLIGRTVLLWAALVLSLGLATGLSLSGHQGEDGGWLPALADWVHLSAGTLWLGGLVMLGVVVWPAAKELRRDAFWRFSQVAGLLIAVVIAAGVFLSFRRLPALNDLWDEGYGQVLLVKLGLVALALAWGGFHHVVVRPRLDRSHGLLSRTLLAEGAVGVAILLVAAVLVDSKPPEASPQPAEAAGAVSR